MNAAGSALAATSQHLELHVPLLDQRELLYPGLFSEVIRRRGSVDVETAPKTIEAVRNSVFEILEMMQDWYNTGLSEPITTTSPYDTVIDPTIATYYPNMDFGTGSNTSIALLYSTGVSPKTVDPYQHDDIQSYFNSAASAVLRVNNLMLAVPSEPEPSAKAARKLMSP
ncbi:hypothetical protein JADG_003640 [Aureobasidium aubasidani]|nr:hypothetical protein JADG_003640 [Aureobasidium pullulans]